MSTDIRAEISQSNPYWISKHRYYELKHFCMQYPEWRRALLAISEYRSGLVGEKGTGKADPTAALASRRIALSKRIDILEQTAYQTDPVIGTYILKGVISGLSYDSTKARIEIPCCKDVYYHLYRRFFWLLDRARD